jgi:hypothetical protein
LVSSSKSSFSYWTDLPAQLVCFICFADALLHLSIGVAEGIQQWVLNESWEAGKIILECDLEINESRPATDYLRR